jgi:transcriptional regulator with XRE-family HTH domain
MSELGKRLRELRKKSGLTQRDVERLAGMSSSYLSQVESGKREVPSARFISRLAELYGVPRTDLLRLAGHLDASPQLQSELDRVFAFVQREELAGYGRSLWEPAPPESVPDGVKLLTIRQYERLTGKRLLTDTFERPSIASDVVWSKRAPLHGFCKELLSTLGIDEIPSPQRVAARFRDRFDIHPELSRQEFARAIRSITQVALTYAPPGDEDLNTQSQKFWQRTELPPLSDFSLAGMPVAFIPYRDSVDETAFRSQVMTGVGSIILQCFSELDSRFEISGAEREHWSKAFAAAGLLPSQSTGQENTRGQN